MKNKPALIRGILIFIVVLSTAMLFTGCKKHGPDEGGSPARGSLQNSKGDCLPGTVHGKWYNGVAPGADTNYVDIGVSISKAGSYRIVSDEQNGVKFSDSGVFSNTGLQTVRLKPNGVFTKRSFTSFTITFDSSVCSFTVDVDSLPLADNTWRFTAHGHVFSGSGISQLYFLPNGIGSILDINGQAGDTVLWMEFAMPHGVYGATPGTYLSNYNVFFDFYVPGLNDVPNRLIFSSDPDTKGKVLTVIISGFEFSPTANRQMIGSFEGTGVDSTGAPVPILNGVFRVGA